MDLLATLRRSGGVSAVAVNLNESPALVDRAISAVLPLIIREMRGEVARLGGGEPGVGGLVALFETEGAGLLASRMLAERDIDPAAGHRLLDRICRESGSVDRLVTGMDTTEFDPAMLARIVPLLAMLVCGYMAARAVGTGAAGSGGPQELGSLYDDLQG